MKVLLTGGAGYIGSHTCIQLIENGYETVIADNFCNSSPKVIDRIEKITGVRPKVYKIDVANLNAVDDLFSNEKIDAVIHFAGYKAVGESVSIPLTYYKNNVAGSVNLYELLEKYNVNNLVFSSRCPSMWMLLKCLCRSTTPRSRRMSM